MKLREIVVIDDSDADLLYAEIILDKSGVADTVITFETAQGALAYLQRPGGHKVDVVLLDINMPEMTGFEFLDRYQHLPQGCRARTVVVMLTSSPDPGDRARAESFRCVKGYVVKPIDVPGARSLVDMVEALGRDGA